MIYRRYFTDFGLKFNVTKKDKKQFNISMKKVSFTTVFNFTRSLGIFHQEKIVFRLLSIIPYIARRQNFSCQSCNCVYKISVIVHNTYCVKCSLSYTADYTGTCLKNPVIFWLIRLYTIADHD